MCQAKLKHRPKIGPTEQQQATEPVCLLVWMGKKYCTADKQVYSSQTVFRPFQPRPAKDSTKKTFVTPTNSSQDSTYQARQYSRHIFTAWEEWINMAAS